VELSNRWSEQVERWRGMENSLCTPDQQVRIRLTQDEAEIIARELGLILKKVSWSSEPGRAGSQEEACAGCDLQDARKQMWPVEKSWEDLIATVENWRRRPEDVDRKVESRTGKFCDTVLLLSDLTAHFEQLEVGCFRGKRQSFECARGRRDTAATSTFSFTPTWMRR